ncbi:MAG: NADP(H)-dependent aldo-keto reductase [Saprospiraceae bacterium]|nr:NADP(H)-dependent aldo-keto reductase [Saprospiraceae bacterium]
MKYSVLGNTGVKVSKICLGSMTWGEQNSEAEAHSQMDYALERQINFFDTAELYAVPIKPETQGLTEKYIGSWLHKTGNRDKIILASKVVGPGNGAAWVRPEINFKREILKEAVELSLKRLQTDYIDLYQLHTPERKTNFFGRLGYTHDPNDPWEENFAEVLRGIDELVKEGKIKYWGLSNETPWATMRCIYLAEQLNLPRLVSVQNPYNLLNRSYEVGLAEISIRENAGLLAYSPLAFGLLSGKFHEKRDTPNDRINQYKQMSRYNGEMAWKATAKYLEIAKKYGVSATQMALAFINTRPFLTSNIIGATTMEQLKENIDSIDVDLTPEMLADIEAIHKVISNPAP